MKKDDITKDRFLIYPKPTWTEMLRAIEDPEYKTDDIIQIEFLDSCSMSLETISTGKDADISLVFPYLP